MTTSIRERSLTGESRWGSFFLGVAAWLVAALFFFPVFWMVLNGFKEEADANASPQLVFDPTSGRIFLFQICKCCSAILCINIQLHLFAFLIVWTYEAPKTIGKSASGNSYYGGKYLFSCLHKGAL